MSNVDILDVTTLDLLAPLVKILANQLMFGFKLTQFAFFGHAKDRKKVKLIQVLCPTKT